MAKVTKDKYFTPGTEVVELQAEGINAFSNYDAWPED
jgi:hypothetical protein